jgi:hypothetical protein
MIADTMHDDPFSAVDQALTGEADAHALDLLIERFRSGKQYPLLFEAQLMRKRLELGLPLIQTESSDAFPVGPRAVYEAACVAAARETGELFLAEGDLERAWPYFRAIGETGPMAQAVEKVEPGEGIEAIIQIALQEGVHPVKGLKLILAKHGMCRAITAFGMYPVQQDREECIGVLAAALHGELTARLQNAIEGVEGSRPETDEVRELVAGRDWLFGEYDYYVDTSHLSSILQYAPQVRNSQTLGLLSQFCEYGHRLSEQFKLKGNPPFEEPYADYGAYIQVLLGNDVDSGIEHFSRKLTEAEDEYAAMMAAQALVNLLVHLERYDRALEVALEHLQGVNPSEMTCPSPLHLCRLAGDYERLRELARESGDLLSYTAASIEQARTGAAGDHGPGERAARRA